MFTACFPRSRKLTSPSASLRHHYRLVGTGRAVFFFGFLGYVRGDAPGTAVGRALFAKYILGTPLFFWSFARICFWLLRECRGGGGRPPSSHRFLNEFQTGSRASGVRPFSRHGGTDTPTINCAWRGGIIRNPRKGKPSERDTVDNTTLKKQRLRVCTVSTPNPGASNS